jgi:hypothetical protein
MNDSSSEKCRHNTMSVEEADSSGLKRMSANCKAKTFMFAYMNLKFFVSYLIAGCQKVHENQN